MKDYDVHLYNGGVEAMCWLKEQIEDPSSQFTKNNKEKARDKIKELEKTLDVYSYHNCHSFFQQDDKKHIACLSAENQLLRVKNSLNQYKSCIRHGIDIGTNPIFTELECYHHLKYSLLKS